MRTVPSALLLAFGLLAASIPSTRAANTGTLGGPGGGPAQYFCADHERLVGIGARYGSWLDWVGPICAPISADSGWGGMPRGNVWVPPEQKSVFEKIGSTWASFLPWNLPNTIKGFVGPQVVIGTREPGMGGEGGHMVTFAVCPEHFFVYGFDATVIGGNKNFVARLSLRCRNLQTNDESWVALPGVQGGGPYYSMTGGDCPAGEMASGIHGRSGIFVDSFGLTCRPTSSKAFCQGYTNQAVAQVQEAVKLGCGFGGARWTPNPGDHLGWCMSLGGNQAAPNSEGAARAQQLGECKANAMARLKTSPEVLKLKKGAILPKIAGAAAADAAPAPISFALTCAGGGGMNARVENDTAVIDFAPAKRGTAVAQPNPGECAWHDRGFRPGEPGRLVLAGGNAGALVDAAASGGTFQVRAYNNGQGAMVVTGIDRISPAAVKQAAAAMALVNGDVDIYDVPDGVGNVIGMLRAGTRVPVLLCREDQWCRVQTAQGAVWVWGEFLNR